MSFIKTGLIAFIFVFGLYFYLGSYQELQIEHAREQKKAQALAILKKIKDPNQIIEKFKLYLEKNPKDAKGQFLIGKLYISQNNWQLAGSAFSKAHNLDPKNIEYTLFFVRSSVATEGYPLNAKSLNLLKNVLETYPLEADALAMLAMDSYTKEHYDEAILYWQRLLKQIPADTKAANLVKKANLKARKHEKE